MNYLTWLVWIAQNASKFQEAVDLITKLVRLFTPETVLIQAAGVPVEAAAAETFAEGSEVAEAERAAIAAIAGAAEGNTALAAWDGTRLRNFWRFLQPILVNLPGLIGMLPK